MAMLTAEALLEAIDGPVVTGTLEGKSMPILTRFPDGRIGFRMMGKFAKSEAPAPIVRVEFESGDSVRVGAEQVFVKKGGEEVRAADLVPGDALEMAWDYPAGYSPPDLPERRPSDGTLRVRATAPDGEADVFSAPIRETGRFFLTAGALLKA
ncbi:MAG: hypothetical protein QOD06_955 [Candidatus Binatota bacterium]|jgi:hypothetical protein|nr:hypothetical protein [Candidatus Binatota bacterium]